MKFKIFTFLSLFLLATAACGPGYSEGQTLVLQEGTKMSRAADLMYDSFTCELTEETQVKVDQVIPDFMGTTTKYQVVTLNSEELPCPGLGLNRGYLITP